MNVHSGSDEFARLMKMVHAAEDFGLGAVEARAVAEEALERHASLAAACEWAAEVLAARVLATARRGRRART
jgi:hypothetical protein